MTRSTVSKSASNQTIAEITADFRAFLATQTGARVSIIDAAELAVIERTERGPVAAVVAEAARLVMENDIEDPSASCFACSASILARVPVTAVVTIRPDAPIPGQMLMIPLCATCAAQPDIHACVQDVAKRDVLPTQYFGTAAANDEQAFIRSLPGHEIAVELFTPERCPSLLAQMNAGDPAARRILSDADACIQTGVGMQCVACTEKIERVVGGVAIISRADDDALTAPAITMPICRDCVFTEANLLQQVSAGVRRNLRIIGVEVVDAATYHADGGHG